VILQSLCSYYDRITKSSKGRIASEGFSCESVHFALVINKSGKLIQVLDLRDTKNNRKIPRSVIVPQGPKKSVNIAASFLWGNTSYVLGADDKGKPQRTADCNEAFKNLHRTLLSAQKDKGAKAVLAFLSLWRPKDALKLDDWQDMLKSNLVFKLDGDRQFIHERSEIQKAWLANLAARLHR
jgi:CRISPR-associated protein Csd1